MYAFVTLHVRGVFAVGYIFFFLLLTKKLTYAEINLKDRDQTLEFQYQDQGSAVQDRNRDKYLENSVSRPAVESGELQACSSVT